MADQISCLFESQQPFIMFNELNNEAWLDSPAGFPNAWYSELVQGYNNSQQGWNHWDLGPDFIPVTEYDDWAAGGEGADELHGEMGNDLLYGGHGWGLNQDGDLGQDAFDTGLLFDPKTGLTIIPIWNQHDRDESPDSLYGEGGSDTLFGEGGHDYLSGGAQADLMYGGRGDDEMDGDSGHDVMFGEKGEDTMRGGDEFTSGYNVGYDSGPEFVGGDFMMGNGGCDLMYGGFGDDTMYGGNCSDTMYGNQDQDVMCGENNHDVMIGGNEANFVSTCAVDRQDYVSSWDEDYGFQGGDDMWGGSGRDTMWGEGGDDYMAGEGGRDLMYGDQGPDSQDEDYGDDRMWGQGGMDTMYGGDGNDSMSGGSNGDNMYGEDGCDMMCGDGGNDLMMGGDDHDTMSGDGGNDDMFGDEGNDFLMGGHGLDRIDGGIGDDTIRGGDGDGEYQLDVLTGGEGEDTFVYEFAYDEDDNQTVGNHGNDIITDMEVGDSLLLCNVGDYIDGQWCCDDPSQSDSCEEEDVGRLRAMDDPSNANGGSAIKVVDDGYDTMIFFDDTTYDSQDPQVLSNEWIKLIGVTGGLGSTYETLEDLQDAGYNIDIVNVGREPARFADCFDDFYCTYELDCPPAEDCPDVPDFDYSCFEELPS